MSTATSPEMDKKRDTGSAFNVFESTSHEQAPDAIGDQATSRCPPPVKALTDSRLAALCANAAYRAFLCYQAEFRIVTQRAADRFLRCDWPGAYADAAERLGLYGRVLDALVVAINGQMGKRIEEKPIWAATKAVYSSLITNCNEWEIAESFFNSLTRRVFATVGVDQQVEFVDSDFDAPPTDLPGIVQRSYQGAEVRALLSAILTELGFPTERYADLAAASAAATARLEIELGGSVARIEMVESIFFRGKGAYLVGAAFRAGDGHSLPLALALLNGRTGITLDAVLTGEDDIAILFSFTRSYFRVDAPRPYELVRFLKTLVPRKPLAELYTAIGYNKHGKTELYRDFVRHLDASEDQFDKAEGAPGMVMVVFTLPSYDVVFKLIKDRFDYPKDSSRSEVMHKYRLVFEHDRAGRLVEAYEFEHLRIARDRFRPELLAELLRCATKSVIIEDDYVVIHHLYVERRVRPLNLYLAETDEPATRAAVIDYGQAIKDLAATNIFTGDLLPKNFGVTRHGRVVFYDYDELCWLTDCDFRELPAPTSYEEETAAEPWFSVRENDIFPEEFPRFLGFRPDLLQTLIEYHGDLFQAVAWRRVQSALRDGNILDIFPYGANKRLPSSPERNAASPVATDVRPPTAPAGHACATAFEAVNLWKDLLTKLGSSEELQAKLESMTADALPQARKRMEEFVEMFNRMSNQTIDMFEKTLGVYQATSVTDAQRRVLDLIESSLATLRISVHSALNTNAEIIASWKELVDRFGPAVK
jgi:isocitrate dehydrogenase kinase/phosphatase